MSGRGTGKQALRRWPTSAGALVREMLRISLSTGPWRSGRVLVGRAGSPAARPGAAPLWPPQGPDLQPRPPALSM